MFWSRRPFVRSLALFVTATCCITLGVLGGCPQPQTPNNNGSSTDDNNGTNTPGTNQNSGGRPRPIPPPVIDDGTDDGTGGGTGGSGGGGGTGGTGSSQPITIIITSPADADINILPGGETSIAYEVVGGNPQDGTIAVSLFRDSDGIEDTGDEVVIATGLAPRGTQDFTAAGVEPGSYFLGIRAANSKQRAVSYATGRLVVVGEATLALLQPATDQRVRPNTGVAIQFTIDSLASSVSYEVFADPDENPLNGNETLAFSGGGLSGSGTIFTEGFDPGDYFILVVLTDSVGQTKREYLRGANTLARKIVVDRAPAVTVIAPTANRIVTPGEVIDISFRAEDAEGAAHIEVFRDADGNFNNNEFVFQTIELAAPQQDYTVQLDTTALPAGVYRLGASITDGVGAKIAGYAPGNIRVNGAPDVTIVSPLGNLSIRSGELINLRWNSTDFENRLERTTVELAADANADSVPDGPWQVAVAFCQLSPPDCFGPADTEQITLPSDDLIGRFLWGVRVRDDVGAEDFAISTGAIIVQNDPPTVNILEPLVAPAVRGDEQIPMRFTVGDRENGLLPNPNGINVIVARDDDLDGQPDGDPILELSSPFFTRGQNFYLFDAIGLLPFADADGNGRFVMGVRARDQAGNTTIRWIVNPLLLDSVIPTLTVVEPAYVPDPISRDRIGSINIRVQTTDTSATTLTIVLDDDTNPLDGDPAEVVVADNLPLAAGAQDTNVDVQLADVPAGLYYIYVKVADALDPAVGFYAPDAISNELPIDVSLLTRLHVRDRLIGTVAVNTLDNSPDGAVLRGFNINDLAGTSMSAVPDINGDEIGDFVVSARFGRAYLLVNQTPPPTPRSYGFGEAYLIYGSENRLHGIQTFNAVGQGAIEGVIFPAIRARLSGSGPSTAGIGTEGMSDFAVIPDMDGDELPDLAFGFPRVESIALSINDSRVQSPSLFPDISGMGSLEFNAWNAATGTWNNNLAQFTRGGVVIVSSHNTVLQNPIAQNRRNSRAIDLHEVGQMFSAMARPGLVRYVRQVRAGNPAQGMLTCPVDPPTNPPTTIDLTWPRWNVVWDVVFTNQPAGGFLMPWTGTQEFPPLANPTVWPSTNTPAALFVNRPGGQTAGFPDYFGLGPVTCAAREPLCEYTNTLFDWTNGGMQPFPCGSSGGAAPLVDSRTINQSWNTNLNIDSIPPMTTDTFWTGFYGPAVSITENTIGARVLGGSVNDRFGTSVTSDGIWLYVSAPERTALKAQVPDLLNAGNQDRASAGVVYQIRVDSRVGPGLPTRSQLWMEPFDTDDGGGGQGGPAVWPEIDKELAGRTDDTMPVPHQYIVETLGSLRNDQPADFNANYNGNGECPPAFNAGEMVGPPATSCRTTPFPQNTAGWHLMNNPQEIVGPHVNAKLRYTRALDDMNGDGIRDVAIGSLEVKENFTAPSGPGSPANPTGQTIGAVFLLYSRPTSVPGDYLLERIAFDPGDSNRLNGVYLKGVPGAPIGRSFDTAGDFNGDGVEELIVGSEMSNGGDGEVIVLLGSLSDTRLSPAGGWTFAQAVAANAAIRFVGAAGERAGYNVSGAGDVDGDGLGDILISAPGTGATAGTVYLVYGSREILGGTSIDLDEVGTAAVPGVKFTGRAIGDFLGGGEITDNFNPTGPTTQIVPRGLSRLGDIDGDGLSDYAISAIRARPNGRTNAGEVYVIYGKGDQLAP